MKIWFKWTLAAVVTVAIAAVAIRTVTSRNAQKQALEAQQAIQKAQVTLELTASDLVQVAELTLSQVLPISGPLKAVNSAFVKARVAGELQILSVREGDFVAAGQVVARVDATESQSRLRQTQQQAGSAKAQVDIAKRSFDNNRSLVDQGFISKTALESSSASLAAAQANFQAAQAGVELATKGLDDTTLKAPIAGQIAQRLAQPGERVAIDTRILEIVDLRHLEMEASLGASDSMAVKVGQRAALIVEGISQPVNARVARINPSAMSGSRAVLVYLALEPSKLGGQDLRQGLYAQGTLSTGTVPALALPVGAVRTDKPEPYVQVMANGQVVHQTIVLGQRGEVDGQSMVAVQGLPVGTQVLNGTVGSVRSGTLLKLAPVTQGPK
jgi:RND family efflux transporter MFP subunit